MTLMKEIENWLNNKGKIDKTEVVRYNENTAISFWACGAIVCIYDMIRFIHEDDDVWYAADGGTQCGFSIAWADSFIAAMERLTKYVQENGKPSYFYGTDKICKYTL